ncbi:MAG: hypothetical protein R3F37_18070 [Candidatus Competibacteraceae bacterium]
MACKIQHDIDHHFVVVKVGSSQWWVIDPWVHTSFVLPWRYNYFQDDGAEAHIQMTVHTPVAEPFGLPFDQNKIATAHESAKNTVSPGQNDQKFQKNWSHPHNLRIRTDTQETLENFNGASPDGTPPDLKDKGLIVLAGRPGQWG